MSIIRSRLLSCTLVLLACQVGLAAAAPVAMCRAGRPLAADPRGIVCTCAHDDGAECPMHKGKAASAPAGQAETSHCCSGCTEQMVVA